MNILYINHYAGSIYHGMEYRPYYLAREWVRAGHKVTVVAADQSHLRQRANAIDGSLPMNTESVDGIDYIWLRTPPYSGNGVRRVLNMFAFVKKLFGHRSWLRFRPDIVIASSTYPLDVFPAHRIARRFGAKLVFELHDLWPMSPILLGGHSPRHPFMQLLQYGENFACRKSDMVVSILPNTKEHLVEHGMDPARFVHVPNGVALEEVMPEAVELPATLSDLISEQSAAGRLLVGYAGSIGASNAMEYFIQAAALLEDEPIAFVVIGKGTHLEELTKSATSNVTFFPPIPKYSIPTFLGKMDVLFLGWHKHPLYRFGISPNKLMDYMLAGKPVLHSVDAANDLVQSAECGYSVPPEDPEAIASALRDFLKLSPEERQKMGDRGCSYVRSRHNYNNLASAFLSAVDAVEVNHA